MMQKTLKGKEDHDEEKGALGIWDCGSPLYDSYELVSVTHIIDRHLMSLPYLGGSKRNFFLARSFSRANDQVLPTTSINVSNSASSSRRRTCEGSASAAMVTSLDKFDVRKLLKRKLNLGGTGRKEHPEKTKTWLSALLKRIGFWKKI
ncbi:hypothetical protein I3843_02G031200 [Carya illinoinensis]|nr:hypothetical protein I3843_02G031200 [Carya illinoinensis]